MIQVAPAESVLHGQFCAAAAEGQGRARLEHLLAQGANIDASDEHGISALYYAAYRGDIENVKLLVERGAGLNTCHEAIGTPLSIAALRRHTAVVEILLCHGAHLFAEGYGWGSATHCAFYGAEFDLAHIMCTAYGGLVFSTVCLDTLSLLAESETPLQILKQLKRTRRRSSGRKAKCSPFLLAAERGHFDFLQKLWVKDEYERLMRESEWEPLDEEDVGPSIVPLVHTSRGQMSSTKALAYESKASTSSAWSSLGFPLLPPRATVSKPTLLMWAAASLNAVLIENIMQAGMEVGGRDKMGRTALHYAALPFSDAMFEDVEICFLLLSKGPAGVATETAHELLKLTVSLHHAALDPRLDSDAHPRCLKAILECIEPLPSRQASRDVLLDLVSHGMCPASSVDLLCKYATRHDACSIWTAKEDPGYLHRALIAALQHSTAESVISVLLHHGANPNFISGQFRASEATTPLLCAIHADAPKAILAILVEKGADPHLRCNSSGFTPFELAQQSGRGDLIQIYTDKKAACDPPLCVPDRDPNVGTTISEETYDSLDDIQLCNATVSPKTKPVASGLSWLPSMLSLPSSRFRRDSKSK